MTILVIFFGVIIIVSIIFCLYLLIEEKFLGAFIFLWVIVFGVLGLNFSMVTSYQKRLSNAISIEYGQVNYITTEKITIDNEIYNLEKDLKLDEISIGDIIKFDYVTDDLGSMYVVEITEFNR